MKAKSLTGTPSRHKVLNHDTGLAASEQPIHVSEDGRNGLITAIGIILGFILTFFATWTTGDDAWQIEDAIHTLFFAVSIIMIVRALYRSLVPYKQTVQYYEATVRLFVQGIVLFAVGFVTALVIEVIQHGP